MYSPYKLLSSVLAYSRYSGTAELSVFGQFTLIVEANPSSNSNVELLGRGSRGHFDFMQTAPRMLVTLGHNTAAVVNTEIGWPWRLLVAAELARPMISLLPDILYEIFSQAPSPSKDLHHLAITRTEVIWKSWMVSLHLKQERTLSRELRRPHIDFLLDKQQHRQIEKVFGKEVLDYSLNLCQGKFDLLVRMPDHIITQIFSFLDLDDIGHLTKTCKKFQKMCKSEEFWEKFMILQDKHSSDTKKIGITIYKKLLAFHQNAAQQTLTKRRQTAFF